MVTVLIQFRAWGAYLLSLGTLREGAYLRQGAYSGQGTYFFFEKQPNVQNKTFKLIFIEKGTIRETVAATNIT